ncbi:MAG: hypothetical protein EXS03_05900 [Phycisphaerales bacterium]|nr:hypothetical protein [Phycisphaerales bacterium]
MSRELVEWIERKGGAVTVRDLTHGVRVYRGDHDAAEGALLKLVEVGFGRWEADATAPKGGRPTRRFRLVSTVTVTETPRFPEGSLGSGDGDTGDTPTNNADSWGVV